MRTFSLNTCLLPVCTDENIESNVHENSTSDGTRVRPTGKETKIDDSNKRPNRTERHFFVLFLFDVMLRDIMSGDMCT
jgi:hypothetical protein